MNRSCACRDSHTSKTTQPPGFAPPAWNTRPAGQSPCPVTGSIPRWPLTALYSSRPTPSNSKISPSAISRVLLGGCTGVGPHPRAARHAVSRARLPPSQLALAATARWRQDLDDYLLYVMERAELLA